MAGFIICKAKVSGKVRCYVRWYRRASISYDWLSAVCPHRVLHTVLQMSSPHSVYISRGDIDECTLGFRVSQQLGWYWDICIGQWTILYKYRLVGQFWRLGVRLMFLGGVVLEGSNFLWCIFFGCSFHYRNSSTITNEHRNN